MTTWGNVLSSVRLLHRQNDQILRHSQGSNATGRKGDKGTMAHIKEEEVSDPDANSARVVLA